MYSINQIIKINSRCKISIKKIKINLIMTYNCIGIRYALKLCLPAFPSDLPPWGLAEIMKFIHLPWVIMSDHGTNLKIYLYYRCKLDILHISLVASSVSRSSQKNISEGKKTCRLHRALPNEYYQNSCWTAGVNFLSLALEILPFYKFFVCCCTKTTFFPLFFFPFFSQCALVFQYQSS